MAMAGSHNMAMAGSLLFTCRVPATNMRMVEGRFPSSSHQDPCCIASLKSYAWSDIAPELRSLVHLGPHPSSPFDSLVTGRWVKLICGASFQDVADIRNLSMVYTLAGVDCIDCAAEESVVTAVREGIEAATKVSLSLTKHKEMELQKPWIMVSINDDEDVHFRKAEFDSSRCPAICPRPCEHICPASAIKLYTSLDENGASQSGYLVTRIIYVICLQSSANKESPFRLLQDIENDSFLRSVSIIDDCVVMGNGDSCSSAFGPIAYGHPYCPIDTRSFNKYLIHLTLSTMTTS